MKNPHLRLKVMAEEKGVIEEFIARLEEIYVCVPTSGFVENNDGLATIFT